MNLARMTLVVVTGLLAVPAVACHYRSGAAPPTPEELAARRPFIGWIREIRANMIIVDEEASSHRQAEITVLPATEITARSGALVPVAYLRPRLRVTVWFRGAPTESSRILTASAERMIVDY